MADCGNQVRLDAYHDGELSPPERSGVEAHLRGCPACAAELAAIRGMSAAFADAPRRESSHEQLLQLAQSVRAETSDARMLLRLFRGTAVAASVLLACSLAAAAYLSHRTEGAAREAMVLDHVATWSQPGLAQWIADDLRGGREE